MDFWTIAIREMNERQRVKEQLKKIFFGKKPKDSPEK